eukprot:TRINITY_DN12773_c1_g1_i1.p1 TRINITY_DN12773_c1_g1~~TRINITY_DN12773_c1_g1_i1.p1  ORF type:complete len:495 (+),score=34.57 TRINITY_DN12773_c1_g1_i1:77-1561(+)
MAGDSMSDHFILAFGGVIVIVSVGTSILSVSWSDVRAWLCGALKQYWSSIRGVFFLTPCDQLDPFCQSAIAQLKVQHGMRMKTACAVISYFLTSYVIMMCWNVATKSPRWMSFGQDVVLLLYFSTCVVARELRLISHDRAAMVSYLVFIAFAVAWIFTCSVSRRDVALTSVLTMGMRLAFVPCFTDVRVVTFGNLLCTVSSCFQMLRSTGPDSDLFVTVQPFLLFEVMFCALIIAFSEYFRLYMLEDLRKEAIAKANSIEHSALKLLLEHVFDVVLPLDASFRISGNEERLASLLMLDTTRNFSGANIQDFMSFQADRDRFRNQFKAKSSGASPCVSCLNVHMRDGNAANIKVEIFCVAVASFDASAAYWIGVREYADGQFNPLPTYVPLPASRTSAASRNPRRSGTPSHIVGMSLAHQSRSSSADDSNSRSRSASSRSEAKMQNIIGVTVNLMSEESRSSSGKVTVQNTIGVPVNFLSEDSRCSSGNSGALSL